MTKILSEAESKRLERLRRLKKIYLALRSGGTKKTVAIKQMAKEYKTSSATIYKAIKLKEAK